MEMSGIRLLIGGKRKGASAAPAEGFVHKVLPAFSTSFAQGFQQGKRGVRGVVGEADFIGNVERLFPTGVSAYFQKKWGGGDGFTYGKCVDLHKTGMKNVEISTFSALKTRMQNV